MQFYTTLSMGDGLHGFARLEAPVAKLGENEDKFQDPIGAKTVGDQLVRTVPFIWIHDRTAFPGEKDDGIQKGAAADS